MWVNRAHYLDLRDRLSGAVADITLKGQLLDEQASMLAGLRQLVDNMNLRWEQTQEERVALTQRAAASLAMCDVLRVQINELRHEKAMFLKQLFPTAEPAAASIEGADPSMLAGGAQFEDMGDRNAKLHGYDDFIPQPPNAGPTGVPKIPV